MQSDNGRPAPRNLRVLLLPPTSRDAEAIQKVLAREGIECEPCATMADLCSRLVDGAGAIFVSEESLYNGHQEIARCVRAQPVWSDLPIIILSKSGAELPVLADIIATLGNVSVLERPVRMTTLTSIVRSALRARQRQYQVRDQLEAREKAEAERAILLEAERAAREEAERAGQMKDEFLATLGHELRTPLNAVLGWAQLLQMPSVDPKEMAEGVTIIERNARAQAQIIEDLLDMSRIISGKVRLQVQSLDLASVVQAALETVQPAAFAKDIRIRALLDVESGWMTGDPNRLQQVFWNLISNAVKFTPKGGRVQVELKKVDSHLEVSVTDNGEGIDPAFLPHVFDRFRQADATTSRAHGGLGLGLAIVRQLVELHGGTISVHSAGRNRGSTFVVSLPMTVEQASREPKVERRHPAATAEPTMSYHPTPMAGVKVVIVDDEPDARSLLRRVFEDCDAEVHMAETADEAVSLVQSKRPHVLISDIGMPGQDGYGLIRRVRALPAATGGHTPAVALTAYARAEDRVTAIVAGFQHHLSKPVEPNELIAIVASLAGRADKHTCQT
jgi:signal transduction histidine kinase/ActR/RegA family two-component response regulator